MALLFGFAGVLLLPLSSAQCEDPLPAEKNVSRIGNMKLDPRKKMLTWNYRGNVTRQECKIHAPPNSSTKQSPQNVFMTPPPKSEGFGTFVGNQVQDQETYFCHFPNIVLHRGATLTVNGIADGAAFQCVLPFRNPGQEGSGAVNFSCIIYNVRLMNCSWAPGPKAPADVWYHLYSWPSRDEDEVECPHYIVDPRGTRVGCHFDELREPQLTEVYFFLVNGTSKGTAVQFLDFPAFKAVRMEKLNPPANVTVGYNGSHHVIRWDNPKTRFDVSSTTLCYELDIQWTGSSFWEDSVFQAGQEENAYLMPGAAVRGEHTVRVRGKYKYNPVWSDWSATQHFGRQELDVSSTAVALVGLLVGAVVLVVAVLTFLCTRWPLRRVLFPPVPQVKTELAGSFATSPETIWDGDNRPPSSREPEDIVTVEEMQPFVGAQAETAGAALPRPSSENLPSEPRPRDA